MLTRIKNIVIGTKEVNGKSKYFWYTLGCALFAVATLIMTIVVSRQVGEKTGGMFSIGLSIAQWLSTIGYFEVRTYQVTDVKGEYSFSDYFSFRLIMCIFAYAIAIAYVFINGYSPVKINIVLLLCLYKILEGIADVFEGEFQKNDRIDISGKSMFFRTLITVVVLTTSLMITKNILFTLILVNIFALISMLVLNIIPISYFAKLKFNIRIKTIIGLFLGCGPLAISTFINTYIINSSKLAVDRNMGDEYQLYYTAVFMPNMVINLFSGIVFKPMQTTMATYFADRKMSDFRKVVFKMISIIVSFTLICIIGAYIIGIPVLSAFYKVNLSTYKYVLLILLSAGGFNAINILLYYILTIMRKQNIMVFMYGVVALASLLFIDKITVLGGLTGAAVGYLLLVIFLMILQVGYILIQNRKIKKSTI